ncbi:Transcriptional regulator, ArsR family OS=Tsukamurella paurometabola (strain ATCC 8368 / DSM/ CCUG 35730 / CIP 100753 / JCM 10117 / KCTC 9821 / NBRC 16120/ NCIMB 702349 / NCTC 13040) OX=521096 GN=Tpau_1953 PE=4 SV=1 [Tsukamurella paurometabola]|uniref:Transcriptional regulator, ArsR family n=1 Tax=Tsukamurella paurometabola (strain ATCC 8368 / DSM 20162 / CCUG 35730 / CIP 100753 / JCM 10117 / KCTC 9821 / NBRC 16120 / NCIMB 702349 / NCTC 13040) TaxID=521096 RepID=D5UNJ7_TSUPD|nr:metalloregulator ArsR/SmtB family transcription factor [Tsukamurella paurometabola]ADG78565.1 transcriptional regulator, ArsR family [Tsukamurella paurometabola DSM 20162]SUP32206.1 Uncharacterized protein conserved in archaea [Tsukamurella paurometabola]
MTVFAAIADPVRRDILSLLRAAPRTAGEVAASFEISRPAISRHLRVLREAGLVAAERGGDARERSYALRLDALAEVEAWIEHLRAPARFAELLGSPALDTEVRRARRDARNPALAERATHDERGTA